MNSNAKTLSDTLVVRAECRLPVIPQHRLFFSVRTSNRLHEDSWNRLRLLPRIALGWRLYPCMHVLDTGHSKFPIHFLPLNILPQCLHILIGRRDLALRT
jgi:hypothetical protein